jgi:hypothetical protein
LPLDRRQRHRPPWPRARTGPPCCRHTLSESFQPRLKLGTLVEGVSNGEQQIEVACRGADTHQEARAASAPHSSAAWIARVLRKQSAGPKPVIGDALLISGRGLGYGIWDSAAGRLSLAIWLNLRIFGSGRRPTLKAHPKKSGPVATGGGGVV